MSGEDFLGRWARRKAAVAAEAPARAAPEPPVADEPQVAPQDTRPDAEILADLGLPDPDSLMPGDDVKAFLAKAVPEHLRRRALRRLWRSDPVFANLDGLNDYDGDFTGTGVGSEGLKTVYEVGKGFAKRVAKAVAGDEAAPVAAEAADPEPPEPDDSDQEPDADIVAAAPQGTVDTLDEPRRPRRMQFRT